MFLFTQNLIIMSKKIIQILIDNPNSWFWEYIEEFKNELINLGYFCFVRNQHSQIIKGDILILLSCEMIFKNLSLNKYNLVIHESSLPKGKGWSPLTWQVLEGKQKIPITLFEAGMNIDDGDIYFQDFISLTGLELIDELRNKQSNSSFELIKKFLRTKNPKRKKQTGFSTYYKKRTPADSELDLNKSLRENFNLLRVVDNDRYPAFFRIENQKYKLTIEKIK